VQMTERDDAEERQSRLAREGQEIDRRISRLVGAIETGGEAPPVMAKLRTLEAPSAIDQSRVGQPAAGSRGVEGVTSG